MREPTVVAGAHGCDTGGKQRGPAFTGMAEADYAKEIERTPWGVARRLRSSVTVGEVIRTA